MLSGDAAERGGENEYLVDIVDHNGSVMVKNNLMYSPVTSGTKLLAPGSGAATVGGNLDNVDPSFNNPAKLDFSLKPGSKAIGAGQAVPVLDDFGRGRRLRTSSNDVGAVHYW